MCGDCFTYLGLLNYNLRHDQPEGKAMKYQNAAIKTFFVLFAAIFFANITYAANNTQVPLISATEAIQNLSDAVNTAKKDSNARVVFPQLVPKASKPYFASVDATAKTRGASYVINIDKTKTCNGVHVCNVGYVQAELRGNPQIYYDINNKEITEPVMLANHIKGYFTPGHAMGDFFPASIQWRDRDVLYSITWQTDRDTMIKIANSAIMAKSR